MSHTTRTFNPFIATATALLLLVSGSISAAEKTPETIAGTTRVTAEEVIELVGSLDDLVVIDARKASDRTSGGWIEDSIGLPDTDTTPETLAKAVPAKSTPVLFLCNGVKCGRSVESSRNAVKWGYKKIYWFRGGMEEWENKGLPMVKE